MGVRIPPLPESYAELLRAQRRRERRRAERRRRPYDWARDGT